MDVHLCSDVIETSFCRNRKGEMPQHREIGRMAVEKRKRKIVRVGLILLIMGTIQERSLIC